MTLFSSRDHLFFFLARNQRLIIKFAIHLAHKTSYTLRVYSRFFKKHNTEYNSIYFLKSIANKCLVNCFQSYSLGEIRLDVFNFPAKKLRKIWALKIRMRQIFFEIIVSVSNICSNVLNFPAKKNMCAQNTHAPFFFFLIIVSIHSKKSPIKHALFLSYLSFQDVFSSNKNKVHNKSASCCTSFIYNN